MKKLLLVVLVLIALVISACTANAAPTATQQTESSEPDYFYYILDGDHETDIPVGTYRFTIFGEITRISDLNLVNVNPHPSDDKMFFTIMSFDPYSYTLASATTDGQNIRPVQTENYGFPDTTWSPDGTHLTFWRETDPPTAATLCFDPDTENTWCLQGLADYEFVCADWENPTGECIDNFGKINAPLGVSWKDNDTILISASMSEVDGFTYQMYLVDLDFASRSIDRVTYLGLGDMAKISPNGERIVFNPGSGYFYLMDADGRNARQIYVPYGYSMGNSPDNVQWSPDSSQVALGSRFGVIVVNADGTYPRIFGSYYDYYEARWTSDGRSLVYLGQAAYAHDGLSVFELVLIDAITGEPRTLDFFELPLDYWIDLTGPN